MTDLIRDNIEDFVIPTNSCNYIEELHMTEIGNNLHVLLDGLKTNSITDRTSGLLYETLTQCSSWQFVSAMDHPVISFLMKRAGNDASFFKVAAISAVCGKFHHDSFIICAGEVPEIGIPLPHLQTHLHNRGYTFSITRKGDKTEIFSTEGARISSSSLPLNNIVRHYLANKGCNIGHLYCLNLHPFTSHLCNGEIQSTPSMHEVNNLTEAFRLLLKVWPEAFSLVNFIYKGVVFIRQGDVGTKSLTNSDLPSTFMATIVDPIQCADALVHESSHARFNYILNYDPILLNPPDAKYNSPWRKDLRPATGILHGVHAFLNVVKYYQLLASHDSSISEAVTPVLEIQCKKLKIGYENLQKIAKPTKIGKLVMEVFHEKINSILKS